VYECPSLIIQGSNKCWNKSRLSLASLEFGWRKVIATASSVLLFNHMYHIYTFINWIVLTFVVCPTDCLLAQLHNLIKYLCIFSALESEINDCSNLVRLTGSSQTMCSAWILWILFPHLQSEKPLSCGTKIYFSPRLWIKGSNCQWAESVQGWSTQMLLVKSQTDVAFITWNCNFLNNVTSSQTKRKCYLKSGTIIN
jgi:hypothetical protein